MSPKGISTVSEECSVSLYRILPGKGSFWWRAAVPLSRGFSTCPVTILLLTSSKTIDPGGSLVILQATSFPLKY